MKKICLSLLLMIGASVFASEGPGSGGADKYGNTNTGAKSEDNDHGATLLPSPAASSTKSKIFSSLANNVHSSRIWAL